MGLLLKYNNDANFTSHHPTNITPMDVIRWRTLNTLLNLWLIVAVVGIVSIRCGLDLHTCTHGQAEEVTLSYLLDYGALKTFAASMLAIGAFAEIVAGLWLWYPLHNNNATTTTTTTQALVLCIRIVHTLAWISSLGVGVFSVRDYRTIHYYFAASLFGLLGVESLLLLAAALQFRMKGMRWTIGVQVVVLVGMCGTFLAFLMTKSGWFEVSSIMICVLNYNFLNYDYMHYDHRYYLDTDVEPWSARGAASIVGAKPHVISDNDDRFSNKSINNYRTTWISK